MAPTIRRTQDSRAHESAVAHSRTLADQALLSGLRHPEVADELIVAPEFGAWNRGQFTVKSGNHAAARSGASGVRFQEWDRTLEDPYRERQCQSDVTRLVHSVRKLRENSALSTLVLAKDAVRTKSIGERQISRAKFSLSLESNPKFARTEKAAKECHRRIVKAARRSGFIVEAPKKFDHTTGLKGLEDWSQRLLLRRKKEISPLWLLPLLLALLPFLPWNCQKANEFFGVQIKTKSVLLLVDVSSSMQPVFDSIREEVRNTLAPMNDGSHFVNIITYAQDAKSVLGGLKTLDDQILADLNSAVDQFTVRGGTRLESGFNLASREIAEHGKPTTIIILTDGEDDSIEGIIEMKSAFVEAFGAIDVKTFALTPRVFGSDVASPPINDPEKSLSRFAKAFGGQFGSVGEKP